MKRGILAMLALMLAAACGAPGAGGETGAAADVTGRWDVTVTGEGGSYPTWFELRQAEGKLSGQFVGRVGSARPIPSAELSAGKLTFSLPPQYEHGVTELRFEGELKGDALEGTTNGPEGAVLQWKAVRAPALEPPADPQWGEPIPLFNGSDLTGWKPRSAEAPNQWTARDGALDNLSAGADLMTEQAFRDFKLQLELKYPEGSNSGIYLRGRYEVQVEDSYGKETGPLKLGAVYGFLTPSSNAAKPAGEWQSYEITLLGRRVTIVLNGETIIDNQEIPGITGGALDSREGEPGPILLQGDHGPVTYRNIVLTPVK